MKAPGFLPDARFRRAERRVEAFRPGVESTRSDGTLPTVWIDSAIECRLLVACCRGFGPGFREVNLSITDGIIFLGLLAFGSIIERPGLAVGCKWASVGYGPSDSVRAARWPPRSPSPHSLTFIVVVPAVPMLAVREGFKWRGLRLIGREVSM